MYIIIKFPLNYWKIEHHRYNHGMKKASLNELDLHESEGDIQIHPTVM
jgi:hypothetical protein